MASKSAVLPAKFVLEEHAVASGSRVNALLYQAQVRRHRRYRVAFGAGRVFTTAGIPVTGGAPYCLSAWVRGDLGANPFLGIQLAGRGRKPHRCGALADSETPATGPDTATR